jgi:hypothetical protein
MARKYVVAGALGAVVFLATGPLQHVGALPETVVGNASKVTIKSVLNIGVSDAWGSCGNHGGGNHGGGKPDLGWLKDLFKGWKR